MVRLQIPTVEQESNYKEMIKEWQQYGGPYAPCIIDYDCQHSIEELDYGAVLKVVHDYSVGNLFEYDLENFERSDFYFVFDDDSLIGMGEIRHSLKPLGKEFVGNIAIGIRPSERKKGYGLRATECLIEKLKNETKEIILCHASKDIISPKICKKLDFEFDNTVTLEDNQREIKRYTKQIRND